MKIRLQIGEIAGKLSEDYRLKTSGKDPVESYPRYEYPLRP